MNRSSDTLPPLEGLHFLVPSNKRFLQTRQGHITTPSFEESRQTALIVGAFFIPFSIAGVLMAFALLLKGSSTLGGSLIGCGASLMLSIFCLLLFRVDLYNQFRRLEREGTVIIGEVLADETRMHWSMGMRGSRYMRTVKYRFITPSGQESTHTKRHPVLTYPFPKSLEAGTRIAILYISPSVHEVL